MKKLFAMVLALAMTFSLAIDAGAYDANSTKNTSCVVYEQDGIIIEMIEESGTPIVPKNTLLDLIRYTGRDDFEKTVFPTADQGNAINIYIDNSQGKGDVHPHFNLNGTILEGPQLTLGAGRQFTYRLTREDGGNISGNLYMRVTTYDEALNFGISVRQFYL